MVQSRLGNFRFFAAIVTLFLIFPTYPGKTQALLPSQTGTPTLPPPAAIGAVMDRLDGKWNLKLYWANNYNGSIAEYAIYRLENYAPDKTLRIIGKTPAVKPSASRVIFYRDFTIQAGRTYTYFVTS